MQDFLINVGGIVNGAPNLESRYEIKILNSVKLIVPKSVEEIENQIVWTNVQKVILALFNINGMFFGALRALNLEYLLQKDRIENEEFLFGIDFTTMSKGQLNSEWIYEVIVSPKMQT